MKQTDLDKLVSKIAAELRSGGEVLDVGNNYRISHAYLNFKDDAGHLADGELFHAGRHGGDDEGKYPDATVEEAADAFEETLKKLEDWKELARRHTLYGVFVTVTKLVAAATRYLYNVGGGGVGSTTPDDPWIVF